MLSQFSQFSPFIPLPPCTPPTLQHASLSSCPWVVHISSLSSLFPIPFLISPHQFYAYQLCFFCHVPFLSYSSLTPPHWNPSMWCSFLWFCFRSSCLVSFCFHCFSFLLGSVVDSCEFVVILLFIYFIFFLDKSL